MAIAFPFPSAPAKPTIPATATNVPRFKNIAVADVAIVSAVPPAGLVVPVPGLPPPAATAPDVTIIFAADVTSGISVTKDLFPLPPAVTTPVAPPKPPAPPVPHCTYNISGNNEA
jgi:hypothetical protein